MVDVTDFAGILFAHFPIFFFLVLCVIQFTISLNHTTTNELLHERWKSRKQQKKIHSHFSNRQIGLVLMLLLATESCQLEQDLIRAKPSKWFCYFAEEKMSQTNLWFVHSASSCADSHFRVKWFYMFFSLAFYLQFPCVLSWVFASCRCEAAFLIHRPEHRCIIGCTQKSVSFSDVYHISVVLLLVWFFWFTLRILFVDVSFWFNRLRNWVRLSRNICQC